MPEQCMRSGTCGALKPDTVWNALPCDGPVWKAPTKVCHMHGSSLLLHLHAWHTPDNTWALAFAHSTSVQCAPRLA